MATDKKVDKKYVETPLMKQYYAIKAVHPDAILLFRVGDFYETFGEDAIEASGILGITLTRRANGVATYVELAGFPYHAIDSYLPKLVRAGKRVAICEQLEDPKTVKGLVKRGVIELVTPGVVLNDNILENKENIYLASVFFGRENTGVAFLDVSTGEFFIAEGDDQYIDKLLSNLSPKEVVYQRGYEDRFANSFGTKYYTYKFDDWIFSYDVNLDKLCKQFGTSNLKGFGVDNMPNGISAAGAILYYLEFTEHKNIAHISSISRLDRNDYVWIDKYTIRNLELFSSNGSDSVSFVNVIDRTHTPMGGRLLKRWVAMPVLDRGEIGRRQDVVQAFVDDRDLFEAGTHNDLVPVSADVFRRPQPLDLPDVGHVLFQGQRQGIQESQRVTVEDVPAVPDGHIDEVFIAEELPEAFDGHDGGIVVREEGFIGVVEAEVTHQEKGPEREHGHQQKDAVAPGLQKADERAGAGQGAGLLHRVCSSMRPSSSRRSIRKVSSSFLRKKWSPGRMCAANAPRVCSRQASRSCRQTSSSASPEKTHRGTSRQASQT